MGGAIYDNPLAAVRELVQNAVDACKLRDAVLRLEESGMIPSAHGRIWVRYEEPTDACPQPKLIVRDTGTGMDEYILRSYFLKVGQSYYRSAEFGKQRIHFRKKSPEFDFAPVSEFGVGFLSCFLLADRVRVRTAMAEAPRGDTRKRTLVIDGPHSADPA
jgi:HSP90 family molecular chaperone